MKILFDTNVALDVLLDRIPHAKAATFLFDKVEQGEITGYLCATTLTTISYLATRGIGAEHAEIHIRSLLKMFEIAAVNRSVLEAALHAGFTDFEDAVLYDAANHVEAAAIVTRNGKDFIKAKIAIYSPDELIAVLVSETNDSQDQDYKSSIGDV